MVNLKVEVSFYISPTYCVFIWQLTWYARACSSEKGAILRICDVPLRFLMYMYEYVMERINLQWAME